ncbi:MAG: 7TM domain-containing protein, partial [Bacteroidota bacterium]
LISWKIQQGYFTAQQLLPQPAYTVQYTFSLDSLNDREEVFVRTYVPQSNAHQEISDQQISGAGFTTEHHLSPAGQQLAWSNDKIADTSYHLTYSFAYQGQALSYQLSDLLPLQQEIPAEITPWLAPSENIQADDERIQAKSRELVVKPTSIGHALQQYYAYAQSLRPIKTSVLTDAVMAMENGAASCNGKSRLFVALCRAAGIPARVVGGIILQDTEKRTSHLWAEAYVHGHWVPFDPLNGHFAFLPQNYLELYKGDHFLIAHSADIGFDYQYTIDKAYYLADTIKSAYTLWALPLQANLPLSLLKLVLLLPLCVLIVALFKNVVGLKTFGVFLPAIIAMAMADVGFTYGIIIYCLLIAIVGLLHHPLERWGLLYTPRMVALLIAMVSTLLLLTYTGISTSNKVLSAMVFFPIIVLTIAAERFARTIVEDGYQEAIQLQLQTLVVTFCCYLIFTADFLTGYFLTFPETYAILIAVVLLLGRWIGLRITEYRRFNWILS